MKRWRIILAIILVGGLSLGTTGLIVGCSTSQQQKTLKSLSTVGKTVDAAYQSYLMLVVSGALPTNNVPQISQQYQSFQAIFNTALTLATLNSNAVASVDVLNAANQFSIVVDAEKGKKK